MFKERIQNLLKQLCVNLYEREEVMALTLLSAIAGESIFLLGKPGVAKSLIARKLKYAFKDAKSFEYLMNRFSTPDEIFGPVSISKLKDHDKYERITENYLPKSDIVFLDEIWKASLMIQNTFLMVFDTKEESSSVIIATSITHSPIHYTLKPDYSNLIDRFILTLMVEELSDKDNFLKMIAEDVNLNLDTVNSDLKISSEDYKNWQESIKKVAIPKEVFDVILYIKTSIDKQNEKKSKESEEIYISDRRWKKAIKILKTSAFLNGRSEVDLMDCFLLKHILWDIPEQIEFFEELIATAVKEYGYKEQVNLSEYEKLISNYEEEINHELIVESVKETHSLSEIVINNQTYLPLKKSLNIDGIEYKYILISKNTPYSVNNITYIVDKIIKAENNYENQNITNSNKLKIRLKRNNTVTVKKGHSYEINYNSRSLISKSEIIEIDNNCLKIEFILSTKPANQYSIDIWNKQLSNYKNQLNTELDKLKKIKNERINNNIFVADDKQQLVEYNITNISKNISNLKNKIQEIEYNYNHISNKSENIEFIIDDKYISEFRKIQNFNEYQTKAYISEIIKKGFNEFNDLKNKSKLNHKDIKRIFETVYKD